MNPGEKQTLLFSKNRKNIHQALPWWRWFLMGLNIWALILSIILSWHYLAGGAMIGCGGGSPCEEVINSRWSTIAGIVPVSGLAVGAYLAMFFAGFYISPNTEPSIRRIAWSALLILAGSIIGSAVWFTILQKWFIGEFCFYCMTTHITGLLLSALVIWRAAIELNDPIKDISRKNKTIVKNNSSTIPVKTNKYFPVVGKSLIGLVLSIFLAAFQIGFTSPAVYQGGESRNNLPVVDYHNVPIIGSPNAPYIINTLFDYKCPHCQQLHLMLNEAIRRYDGKLAFALCPAPLNTQCNPYIPRDVDAFKNSCELAKIGLVVWLVNRDAFATFENWMFTFDSGDRWHPRSLESTKAKAVELVGKEKLDAALSDSWIDQYLKSCINIYGQTMQGGNGGVPKLVFGSLWVVPKPNNADDLINILQKSLRVPKP